MSFPDGKLTAARNGYARAEASHSWRFQRLLSLGRRQCRRDRGLHAARAAVSDCNLGRRCAMSADVTSHGNLRVIGFVVEAVR